MLRAAIDVSEYLAGPEKGLVDGNMQFDPDLDALLNAQTVITDMSESLYGEDDDDILSTAADSPNVLVFKSDRPFVPI